MAPLGDRVLAAFSDAQAEVVIVSPFIKRATLEKLLAPLRDGLPVHIYTRWNPIEVAQGVSDTSVLDFVSQRASATLSLLDNLHAKAFIADERALVGSANATGAGLGWSALPNIETLVEVGADHPDVQRLMADLGASHLATEFERREVDLQASMLAPLVLHYPTVDSPNEHWIPAATPTAVESGYLDSGDTDFSASADVETLAVPPGLDHETLNTYLKAVVPLTPYFTAVVQAIAAGEDMRASTIALVVESLTGSPPLDSRALWQITYEWLNYLFPGQYRSQATDFKIVRGRVYP